MPRLTDYGKLVSKHRAELLAALESIRLQLKPAYIWELTAENCHQIYSRLGKLKIDLFPGYDGTGSATSPLASLSVIELHPWHNNPDPDNNSDKDDSGGDGIAFFGSIPQLLANINSILQQLAATAADSAPNRVNHQNEVIHEHDNDDDSFFIDVSATLPAPRIMQHKEAAVVARKQLLLHIRDYLSANIGKGCLNANHCLRTLASVTDYCGGTQPWDLCFLSGVLLGYPIIYCNSRPEKGNCLAHQPLCNYTVQLDDCQLYSFSVPEVFHAHYRHRINRWFESLRQKAPQPDRMSLHQAVETHALILT